MSKYRRIKYEDRCQIYALSKRGSSQESIAEVLGVSQSAVSREIHRNRGERGYRFKQAEAKAQARQAIRSIVCSTRDLENPSASVHLKRFSTPSLTLKFLCAGKLNPRGECLRLASDKISSVRPGVDVEVTREPVGVVGLIAPWNFPIAIPAWKIAPASADLVPATAHALADIIVRAGIPPGVFNLVMGRGSTVGQALLEHRDVAAISFTGSVATGRRIAQACIASDPMKKMQLEMGGKNPMIVLDDADLKTAVDCAVNGAFFSTGQRCTASSRLIVTHGIHDRFVDAVAERMKTLKIDHALKPDTQIGPVVDQSQLDQDLSYIRLGREEGATLVTGGELSNRDTPGFYLSPALFKHVDNSTRIAREEIFGPGMVMVNLPTAGVDYHVPFGGRKGSSYGPREQGRYAAEFYTAVKTAYTFESQQAVGRAL